MCFTHREVKMCFHSAARHTLPCSRDAMRAVTTGTQVHLLLFMVALFHIVTAALVLVIANLRMRSWWRWKQSDDQEARL